MPAIRRLAAILAADVAGYSRLMGADEEGTLERLKALRSELVRQMDQQLCSSHSELLISISISRQDSRHDRVRECAIIGAAGRP